MEFKTKNLLVAEIRLYYEGKGLVVTDTNPHVVLYKKDGVIFNPLNINDDYPYCERSCFEEGKVILKYPENKKITSGICYVKDYYCDDLDRNKETYTLKEIENFILSSEFYYKDRASIATRRLKRGYKPILMTQLLLRDIEPAKAFQNELKELEQETKILCKK